MKTSEEPNTILEQFQQALGTKQGLQIELKPGEDLFAFGDKADCAYVLIKGRLSILVPGEGATESEIDRLTVGAVVGEMGILAGGTRTATVRAIEPAQLIQLRPKQFEAIQKKHPHLLTDIATVLAERWQRVQLFKVLEGLFDDLDAGLLHLLQARLEWVHLNQGETLFEQGSPADGMYIVVTGRLKLVGQKAGYDLFLSDLIEGEAIGANALISEDVHRVMAYAIRACSLVKMTPALFQELAPAYPQLLRSILKIIVERQQRFLSGTMRSRGNESQTITLLPSEPMQDIRRFAEQLHKALSAFGQTRLLTDKELDAEFGQPGASQWGLDHPSAAALTNWLHELEAKYQHIILIPDSEWSPWTQRCLNQSDRALFVATPDQNPEPQQLERTIAERMPRMRRELVLWHSAETTHPQNTIRWLEPRDKMPYYHVRDGDQRHFGRIARRITGRGIGFVLGGGGAKGYAHAGVYRRLLEMNVDVDYIGGTSFGSLVGCFFAREMTFKEIEGLFDDFSGNHELFDRTLPFVALNTSQKLNRYMQKLYGDWQLEDLWVPFFCIGANLTHATEIVMDRGSVASAIRKSISVPGVFSPVIENGEIFVDGGIINNFPVDEMAKRVESTHLIGVLVGQIERSSRKFDIEDEVSGWRVLARSLNPFAKRLRVPGIGFTLMRTMEVHNIQRTRHNRELCEVLIMPDTSEYSLLNFETFEPIAEIGYESAEKPLANWKKAYDAQYS